MQSFGYSVFDPNHSRGLDEGDVCNLSSVIVGISRMSRSW